LSGGVHVGESGNVLVLQTFKNGNDLGMSAEVRAAGEFISEEAGYNPNCQNYIYNQYPLYTGNVKKWDSIWTDPTPFRNNNYSDNYFSQAFAETLGVRVSALNPTKPKVLLIPLGHVLYQVVNMIANGGFPGLDSIKQLYSGLTSTGDPDSTVPVSDNPGECHLSPKGIYIQVCTQYAVLFKADPHNGPINGAVCAPWPPRTTYSVPADFAAKVWDVVWQVVTSRSDITGVTGSAVSARQDFSLVHQSAHSNESTVYGLYRNNAGAPGGIVFRLNGARVEGKTPSLSPELLILRNRN
jgi:hypothetical protein